MKIIAHRGNIDGPNPLNENKPDIIDNAISMGFDVEVDVRYDRFDNKFYLGHDEPQYVVDWYWLAQRMDNLWIHCKNIDALYEFSRATSGYNYFWHQTDFFTLTSKQYIWTYPGQSYTSKSIIVMPETYLKKDQMVDLTAYGCYGVCTDYPQKLVK
jgi:glycerophosphoryl diester phosphodiesterase